MSKLMKSRVVIAAGLAMSMLFTVNAQAEQVSVEQAIASVVINQSQLLVNEVSIQLQSSIQQQLSQFMSNQTTALLVVDAVSNNNTAEE
jgi:hypothetical protein